MLRRIWCALPGVLVLLALTGCGPGEAGSATLVHVAPDADGPVEEWVLFVPGEEMGLFVPTQAAIVAAASPSSRASLFHASDKARQAMERELKRLRFEGWDRLTWIREDGPLTPWARDQFVCGEDASGRTVFFLHHPRHYEHLRATRGVPDGATPRAIERLSKGRAIQTRARLEGGTIVCDEKHALLSRLPLDIAVGQGDARDAEEARHYLEALYGVKVVPIPSPSTRPAEHADLYVTLLGRGRAMLADPSLGLELLARLTPAEADAFDKRVRALADAPSPDVRLRRLRERRLLDEFRADMEAPEVAASYEAVAAQLRGLGYVVTRVPWLGADSRNREMPVPVFSYNNVVLEEGLLRPVVFLPVYGLPPLDDAAARLWERQGYEVRRIPALGPAIRGGAVHCLTQTIRRPHPVPRP